MASYGFHSEAADEYAAATRYYLDHASPLVTAAFVAEIEAAIQTVLASPTTLASNRRASNSAVLAQAISVFSLLSMGTGARPSVCLCGHALQPASRLLA